MSWISLRALIRLSALRQALWMLVLFSAISLVAWGGTFFLVEREILRSIDDRLTARMAIIVADLDAGGTLRASADDDETAVFVETTRPDGFISRNAEDSSTAMRYLLVTTPHGRLRIGEDVERQEELLDLLAGGMQLSLLGTLIMAGIAGLWAARQSQRRLDRISAGLATVARGDLTARIRLKGSDDLGLLADRIDGTTARLEDAMTRMRVQSSNIAHDLRTPLARLRAGIERAADESDKSNRPVDPDALSAALEQIDQITETFDSLLRLAQIESGAGREAFRAVDLGVLVSTIEETFGPVVEDAGQVLQVESADAATVPGDPSLLIQLAANLIQNAMRHGAEKQTITVRAHGHRLSVTDQGPGIPFAEREDVLQPLHQGETTRQGEGHGLGLSLVRAVAELHGAQLILSDGPNGRGLRATVAFPATTDP